MVVIDDQLPRPDHDSGSVRMLALLAALVRTGRPVHFLPANRAYRIDVAAPVEALGVEVLGSLSASRAFFNELGSDVDVVIISRPMEAAQYLQKIRRWCPGATVLYDMVDHYAVRHDRMAAVTGGATTREMRRLAAAEAAAMRRADGIIAITDVERTSVQRLHPDTPVHVFTNIHTPEPLDDLPGRSTRHGLLFVGGFAHAPNRDAAAFIVDELAPLVAERLPGVVTSIVGADPPVDLVERAPTDVRFLGWQHDLEPHYRRARVVIAPLRAGAGMKGKIGEAMALGAPVVTTAVGAEGFGASSGEHLLVAEGAEALVAAIALAYEDDEVWSTLSRGGWELIATRFSPEAADEALRAILDPAARRHG